MPSHPATYEVELPGGEVYEIDGPEGLDSDPIKLQLYTFGELSKNDEIRQAYIHKGKQGGDFTEFLRSQAQEPRKGEGETERMTRLYGGLSKAKPDGVGEGMLRSGLQGLTFGGGDELTAFVNAVKLKVTDGMPFEKAYSASLNNEREKIESFRESNPALSLGTELAGSIPTALVTGGGSAMAAGGRMAAGAATGVAQGGLYGFLSGEGSDRIKSMIEASVIGGGIGAAAPVVAGGAGRLARNLLQRPAAREAGLSNPAYKVLNRASMADDSLGGAGEARIAQAGDEAMFADAGQGAKGVVDTILESGGPGARVARENIQGRAGRAADKTTQALDDSLGQPGGIREASRDIAQSTRSIRGPAYDAAYDTVIDYSSGAGQQIDEVMQRVPSRILKEAVEEANESMMESGVRNQQILLKLDDAGEIIGFEELANVQQLDFLKRALDQLGRDEIGRFGKTTGRGGRAQRLAGDLRRAIVDATGGEGGTYSEALRVGKDKIEMDQALELGYDALKSGTTREVVAEGMEGASDAARTKAAQGVRSVIDDTTSNVKRTLASGGADTEIREAVSALKSLSSRANRTKLGSIIGDDNATALFDEIDRLGMAFELQSGTATGSRTYGRQAARRGIDEATEGGVLASAGKGDLSGGIGKIIQMLTDSGSDATAKISDDVMLELAEILTSRLGPERIQNILRKIAEVAPRADAGAKSAQSLTERLLRSNAGVSAPMINQ